jgi:hypothetical protein
MAFVNRGESLRSGESLKANEFLQSSGRNFYLIMQADGNCVIYNGPGPDLQTPAAIDGIWSTGPNQKELTLDANGNLVAKGRWQSGSIFPEGKYFLIMQSDGNLVIYCGEEPCPTCASDPLWSSNTGLIPHRWRVDIGRRDGHVYSSISVVAESLPAVRSHPGVESALDGANDGHGDAVILRIHVEGRDYHLGRRFHSAGA